MCNPFTKIIRFSAMLSILFFGSCQETEYDVNLLLGENGNFLYKTEKAFCQQDPKNEIYQKTFSYDKNGNLTEETTYRNNTPDMKTTSNFNQNNQPVTDSVFYFVESKWKANRCFKYIYSNSRLDEKQQYNSDGNLTHRTIYKYKGSKSEWEEFYYFIYGDWKFQYAHKFEYNRSGQMIKKISYQDESKEKIYDQFIYTYKGGKLATETRILLTGETRYLREYFYTREGFRDEVVEDGNTIEKNYYENGKFTEKRTWYFGIDPGFYPCGGNSIYKYEY